MTNIIKRFRKPTIKFGDIFVSNNDPETSFSIVEKLSNGEFFAMESDLNPQKNAIQVVKLIEVGFYHNNNDPVAIAVDSNLNFYTCTKTSKK